MELEGSLLSTLESASCHYPESDEPSPQLPTLFP